MKTYVLLLFVVCCLLFVVCCLLFVVVVCVGICPDTPVLSRMLLPSPLLSPTSLQLKHFAKSQGALLYAGDAQMVLVCTTESTDLMRNYHKERKAREAAADFGDMP